MIGPAILIPCADLATFSSPTRNEILGYAGLGSWNGASPINLEASNPQPVAPDGDGPPDLTAAMARKLIAAPISPKSTAVLRVIAESATPEFHLADAISAAPDSVSYLDLKGAWSGITRRARKILDDNDADLIWWEGDPTYDPAGNYIDQVGRVSTLTHQSLRTAFGIRAD